MDCYTSPVSTIKWTVALSCFAFYQQQKKNKYTVLYKVNKKKKNTCLVCMLINNTVHVLLQSNLLPMHILVRCFSYTVVTALSV